MEIIDIRYVDSDDNLFLVDYVGEWWHRVE